MLALALFVVVPVRAQEKRSLDALLRGSGNTAKEKTRDGAKERNAADTVDIRAHSAEWDLDGRTGDLVGNVIVTYEDRTLSADRMKVFMNEKNELERVEAHGNVVMREKDGKNRATGGKAVYDILKNLIVLSESPVLYRGDEWKMENAKTVTYNLDKREFKAVGDPDKPEQGTIITIKLPKRKKGTTSDGGFPFDFGRRNKDKDEDKSKDPKSRGEDTRKNDGK